MSRGLEWVTPLEVTAAINRALPGRERADAERRWWAIWSRMVPVALDGPLYELALESARKHRLRSLDALHLAGALRMGCGRLVTFGGELAAAAETDGIEVVGGAG
jgi:predicted nucleic acid-binding protein